MSNRNPIGIPLFPEFSEIKLEYKKIFDDYFAFLNPQASELSFGYLFAWRGPLKLKLTSLNENLFIFGDIDNELFLFEPVGKNLVVESAMRCLEYFNGRVSMLSTESFSKRIFKKCPDRVRIISQRDYYDYVYKTQDLAMLKGTKFQSKRNFINRFEKNYNYVYRQLDDETIILCQKFLDEWNRKKCVLSSNYSKSMIDDSIATYEMLTHFKELKLYGWVILVGDRVVAFTIGEALNKNTYVVHVEKANTEYIGAYQMINYLTSNTVLEKGFEFINREEDLGQPNLRKAKMSYHPCCFVEKYRITLIEKGGI